MQRLVPKKLFLHKYKTTFFVQKGLRFYSNCACSLICAHQSCWFLIYLRNRARFSHILRCRNIVVFFIKTAEIELKIGNYVCRFNRLTALGRSGFCDKHYPNVNMLCAYSNSFFRDDFWKNPSQLNLSQQFLNFGPSVPWQSALL